MKSHGSNDRSLQGIPARGVHLTIHQEHAADALDALGALNRPLIHALQKTGQPSWHALQRGVTYFGATATVEESKLLGTTLYSCRIFLPEGSAAAGMLIILRPFASTVAENCTVPVRDNGIS
ncbi:MAG: hypothetical protein ACP5OR_06675 [Candidatus Dormibacteria bacterium]